MDWKYRKTIGNMNMDRVSIWLTTSYQWLFHPKRWKNVNYDQHISLRISNYILDHQKLVADEDVLRCKCSFDYSRNPCFEKRSTDEEFRIQHVVQYNPIETYQLRICTQVFKSYTNSGSSNNVNWSIRINIGSFSTIVNLYALKWNTSASSIFI